MDSEPKDAVPSTESALSPKGQSRKFWLAVIPRWLVAGYLYWGLFILGSFSIGGWISGYNWFADGLAGESQPTSLMIYNIASGFVVAILYLHRARKIYITFKTKYLPNEQPQGSRQAGPEPK